MTFSGHDDSTINIVLGLLLLLFYYYYYYYYYTYTLAVIVFRCSCLLVDVVCTAMSGLRPLLHVLLMQSTQLQLQHATHQLTRVVVVKSRRRRLLIQ